MKLIEICKDWEDDKELYILSRHWHKSYMKVTYVNMEELIIKGHMYDQKTKEIRENNSIKGWAQLEPEEVQTIQQKDVEKEIKWNGGAKTYTRSSSEDIEELYVFWNERSARDMMYKKISEGK